MSLRPPSIPFHRPDLGEEEAAAVQETIRSGWVNTGPRVELFERELKNFIPASSIIAVGSAWAGLFLTLKAFGIGTGDEVITTPYTFAATANVILQTGASPVFVDIDSSHNLNPYQLKKVLSSRTKAIIPVDMGGIPCDYIEILKQLRDFYNTKPSREGFRSQNDFQAALGRPLILSDAAHAFGTMPKTTGGTGNQEILGDIRVYSFHTVKNITTIDGGAIAICHPALAENLSLTRTLRRLSLHGMTKDAHTRSQSGIIEYDIVHAGYKTNLTDVSAAIGLVQLKRWKSIYERKEEIAKHYNAYITKSNYFKERLLYAHHKNWHLAKHLYTVEIEQAYGQKFSSFPLAKRLSIRHKLLQTLKAEQGIATNLHYTPLYKMTLYKPYFEKNSLEEAFPETEAISSSTFSLPFYSLLSENNVTTIIRALESTSARILNQ